MLGCVCWGVCVRALMFMTLHVDSLVHMLSTHVVHTCCPHMLSTHVVHTCCPHMLSTHVVHTCCPHMLSTHVVHTCCPHVIHTCHPHMLSTHVVHMSSTHVIHTCHPYVVYTHVHTCCSTALLNPLLAGGEDDEVIAVSVKEKKKKHRKTKSRSSHISRGPRLPEPSVTSCVGNDFLEAQTTPPMVETPVMAAKEFLSSSSLLCADMPSESDPCAPYSTSPKTSCSDLLSSEAMEATAQVLSAISEPLAGGQEELLAVDVPLSNGIPVSVAAGVAQNTLPSLSSSLPPSSSSEVELKSAVLALSKIKHDLEIRNRFVFSHCCLSNHRTV